MSLVDSHGIGLNSYETIPGSQKRQSLSAWKPRLDPAVDPKSIKKFPDTFPSPKFREMHFLVPAETPLPNVQGNAGVLASR